MKKKELQWVNTPVLMEAMVRRKKGIMSRQMSLWIEDLLELNQERNL